MKAIMVGLGGRGRYWVKSARQHPECEFVAYVEPMEVNQQKAIEQLEISGQQIHPTLEDAISATQADFVLDVTPPAAHRAVAETAFAAGLHVFGEKPLSDNFDEAKKAVEAGEKAHRKHMITQNYRFGAVPRTTRQLLAEGKIGKPGQCDLRYYKPWADSPGSHYVTQPYMLINDMMVHHFDMMRYVLDSDPVRVHAVTWNHPWGWHAGDAAHSIVFQFADGLVATHVACGCAMGSQTNWNGNWRIEGPLGSIDWNDSGVRYARLHRTEQKTEEEVPLRETPPGDQAMLTEFFAAIREDRQPECSGRDNLKSLAMVFAAIKSAEENRWVDLTEYPAQD
ncbi:MAG: Gfo/Idh/MocA family oxidoreductase [Armatimonadaceae bacterium]